jgi:hypothetical protein
VGKLYSILARKSDDVLTSKFRLSPLNGVSLERNFRLNARAYPKPTRECLFEVVVILDVARKSNQEKASLRKSSLMGSA